eukprot:89249-Amphidinium_carterae.1
MERSGKLQALGWSPDRDPLWVLKCWRSTMPFRTRGTNNIIYSLRAVPQLHGAAILHQAEPPAATLEDNPCNVKAVCYHHSAAA